MPAYWLTPGGALETLHLPPDVGLYANPTRAGLVYRERDKEWRHHVMLYTPEGKRVEISSTDAREPAVSPSGCRIAFASAPDARSGTRRTLQVADLCRPRGEQ